ncbi:hypothetical protein FQR65_LT09743 [Abscondita terminalis]|nr:hypothetical protein FQR65_LT09743 [Abscondita terminalis]
MDEIASTKNFFKSHCITLSDYWLESCIQWFRGENPTLNYTLETLHSTVYAQWLLLDLRDVEISVLPQNLVNQKKVVLNNSFCLQMLHIQDISQPKYQQIQKIRNSSLLTDSDINQDYKPVVSAKRMLQMLLTDGVQEIEAIEYRPIKALNINLKPGTKIRIKGPITVRRGQILLEDKNVLILGGEVEELLVLNAYENILARALRLPENPKPNVVEELSEVINEEVSSTVNTIAQYNHPIINVAPSTSFVHNGIPNINLNEHEEVDEIDMMLELERDVHEGSLPLKFDDDDYMFLEAEKNIKFRENSKPSTHTSLSLRQNKECDDDLFFEGMDVDAHLDMLDQQQRTVSVIDEVVSIKSLLNNKDLRTHDRIIINAKFKKVVRKLSVNDDSWILKLLVNDNTGDLEVWVDSKVVTNLTGYAPLAVMSLRKDIINKNETATEALMKIITGLKDKLVRLKGKMVVKFNSEDEPSIIEIL